IVINLDTTGSMDAALGIMSDQIVTFANSLTGINAQFGGMTVGDAFGTKLSSGSIYTPPALGTVNTPSDPPLFDPDERANRGANPRAASDEANFFTQVKTVMGGFGSGGGDAPENYLGAVDWIANNFQWEEGAAKVIITIGDNCAHTPPDSGFITAPW